MYYIVSEINEVRRYLAKDYLWHPYPHGVYDPYVFPTVRMADTYAFISKKDVEIRSMFGFQKPNIPPVRTVRYSKPMDPKEAVHVDGEYRYCNLNPESILDISKIPAFLLRSNQETTHV